MMLSVGPWSLPVVLFLIALAVSVAVGVAVARRSTTGGASKMPSLIIDIVLVGVLAARIGFVIEWLPQYLNNPWSILRIDDGGFSVWPGIVVASLFALWRARRTPAIRRPLGAAMLAAWVSWALLSGSLLLMQQTALKLPTTDLMQLNGSPTTLAALSGKPMVVNLWATWCPPCRREMPLLAAAQQRRPDVTFVFLNQGEAPAVIQRYLRNENLRLENVLLDRFGTVGAEVGSRALPTTLFFDADGMIVDTHIGAFSQASLVARLQDFEQPAANPSHRIPQEVPDGQS